MSSRRVLALLAAPLGAVLLALAAGAILILLAGQSPLAVYGLMIRETLGTGYGLGQSLFKATPLVFAGLAVALGFRAGLFNIGGEGQMVLGGLAAGLIGTWSAAPPLWLLPLALLGAAGAGAAWAAIPGILKSRFGAHEVIGTIMLNFVAFALVSFVGHQVFEPETVHTAAVANSARLPRLDLLVGALRGSPANLAFVLALAAAALVSLLLFRTRFGFELRAVGSNPPAAEYGGIALGKTQVTAMALSGALAGLGGVNFVLGYKHFFELGFTGGAGFVGIAVALVGRSHPLGVVIAALFFGALGYGGLAANQMVPRELVDVLQALVILLVICAQEIVGRALRRSA